MVQEGFIIIIFNTSLNKSRATNKNPYAFYNVLNLNWHVSKFELNRIISFQITYIQCLGDRGSIPGRVIPNTQKVVLETARLNTQDYKVWIKDKVEQSRLWSSVLHYTSVL